MGGRFAAASSAAPVHVYEFDVSSGNCLTESAYCVERFEVHVEGDDILVSEEPAPGLGRAITSQQPPLPRLFHFQKI